MPSNVAKMRAVFLASIAAAALLTTGTAHAGWTGNTVTSTYYFPDPSTVYENDGSGSVPWTGSSVGSLNWSIGASRITVASTVGSGYFAGGSFNGLMFTDTSADPHIINVLLDPASAFFGTPSWTSNSVSLNFQGQFIPACGDAIFDITFAPVPEPASFALLGLGLAGLGIIRRSKDA